MRIALCTNYVSPYRLPVYRELAKHPGWELTVFTTTNTGHDRDWKRYDSDGTIHVVQSRSVRFKATEHFGVNTPNTIAYDESTQRSVPFGLIADLIKLNPDVIITGELGMRTLFAYLVGFLTKTPVIPWTYSSKSKMSVGLIRRWFRCALLHSAPAIIGMGKTAQAALISEGADPSLIFNAPNAADIDTIQLSSCQSCTTKHIKQIQTEIGKHKRIAVVVGRLVQMKAPDRILHAWSLLPESLRNQWELIFVGDGPMKNELESISTPGVRFVGSVSPEEVVQWIQVCDLHIFGSLGDPWGLVVNEAMHLGKPTLCSELAGCCDDLVIEGITGFRFDPTLGLARFTWILDQTLRRNDLAEIGHNARIHAASYTPKRMANGIADAVEFVLKEKTAEVQTENLI